MKLVNVEEQQLKWLRKKKWRYEGKYGTTENF